jgi:hypothetical protein
VETAYRVVRRPGETPISAVNESVLRRIRECRRACLHVSVWKANYKSYEQKMSDQRVYTPESLSATLTDRSTGCEWIPL